MRGEHKIAHLYSMFVQDRAADVDHVCRELGLDKVRAERLLWEACLPSADSLTARWWAASPSILRMSRWWWRPYEDVVGVVAALVEARGLIDRESVPMPTDQALPNRDVPAAFWDSVLPGSAEGSTAADPRSQRHGGRKSWTRRLWRTHFAEAEEAASASADAAGVVLTDKMIAARFRPLAERPGGEVGIDVTQLRRLRRGAELPTDDPGAMPED